MNEFEKKVDLLSDAFESTFSIVNSNTISNMWDIKEAQHVLFLIKTHLGWDDLSRMQIVKTGQLKGTYDIWVVKYEA